MNAEKEIPAVDRSDADPLFIVGPSRSGTSLLRSILNQHPRLWITAETHYFDDLRPRLGPGASADLDDETRRRCQDYFLQLSDRPYGHGGRADAGWLRREDLERERQLEGKGGDAYFEAYCRLDARREGRSAWGEKTPRHMFRVREMLARYPGAKVVCMIRDPRAVVLSYRDWRNQGGFELDEEYQRAMEQDHARARASYDILVASLLWSSTARLQLSIKRELGAERVFILKYEELLQHPERELTALYAWLKVEPTFELERLPVHNSSFERFQGQGGLSLAPLARWQERLHSRELGLIQAVCRQGMRQLGFELAPVGTPHLYLGWKLLTLPWTALRLIWINRQRIAGLRSYLARRIAPLLGG